MSVLITEIAPIPVARGQKEVKQVSREAARAAVIEKRRIASQNVHLEGLQDDNFGVKDPRPDEPVGDEGGAEDDGGKGRKKRQKLHFRKLKERKVLQDVVQNMRNADKNAQNGIPCYAVATVDPSKRPRLHTCSLCGNIAPYKCPRCEERCCTKRCLRDHQDLCVHA